MGKSKVGGWFLIGLMLPVCAAFFGVIVANSGASPAVSLPVAVTLGTLFWSLCLLLRRWMPSSHYYDPRHAHRLFTPYYDKS